MEFTKDQKKVIETSGKNILVSAAAGSGKTAVLVERIIKKITNKDNPVDIDRILVVTFTNAAAAQMKDKIRKALDEYQSDDEEILEQIERQKSLLNMAHIMTIHSFCLSVIRDNFNRIDLDPAFRIADEGELALIREDAMDKVLEHSYEEASEDFIEFLEKYSRKRDDTDVREAVFSLYEYALGKAEPQEWLNGLKGEYEIGESGLHNKKWFAELEYEVKDEIKNVAGMLEGALAISKRNDGPYFYCELLGSEMEFFKNLAETDDFEAAGEKLKGFEFGRLPSKKDESVNADVKKLAQDSRNKAKKKCSDIIKKYYGKSIDEAILDIEASAVTVGELVRLSEEYGEEFRLLKKEKRVVDFSDLEHFAYKIMQQGAADDYRGYFEEIMVDEYQDSNHVQEAILTSITRENNYFTVGDVKQSIYGFRMADPEIFMNRYDSYLNKENSVRIDLKQNFRSRREVLESANEIFANIMSRRVGGVSYDESQKLNTGAFYSGGGDSYKTSLVLFEEDSEGELDKSETEALGVAYLIKDLMENFRVQEDNTDRPLKYSDIAVLMRATSGRDTVFEKIFESRGIPVDLSANTGYFQTDIIKHILNFISIVDNPRQDIPLHAVLKSFFFGFSDKELGNIRAEYTKGCLYDALYHICKGETAELSFTDEKLKGKAENALMSIDKYRELAEYMPVNRLLDRIIRDYDYDIYARTKGENAVRNLRLLIKKAADYEKTSYKGLFHFIRYMEKLKKYNYDTGEVNGGSGNDAVNLLSIHKSKGLEYPVVIVTFCDKSFNMADANATLVYESSLGIGVDAVNTVLKIKKKTLIKNLIAGRIRRNTISEEMRLLYVAMTRAKEKLILTGTSNDPEGDFEKLPGSVTLCKSYLDFLLLGSNAVDPHIERKTVSLEELVTKEVEETSMTDEAGIDAEEKLKELAESGIVGERFDMLKKKFETIKLHSTVDAIPEKIAVTKLKEHFDPEAENGVQRVLVDDTDRDNGKKQGNNAATSRGSAYHKVFELVDITVIKSASDAAAFINELKEKGRIQPEGADGVNPEDIYRFAGSPLAERMHTAAEKGLLFREQPFIILRPATEVDPSYDPERKVLIQGIIDAFFIEDDGIVIVDYKTDRVKDKSVLTGRYKGQLDLYASALEQITSIKVKEELLYSVFLGCEVKIL